MFRLLYISKSENVFIAVTLADKEEENLLELNKTSRTIWLSSVQSNKYGYCKVQDICYRAKGISAPCKCVVHFLSVFLFGKEGINEQLIRVYQVSDDL